MSEIKQDSVRVGGLEIGYLEAGEGPLVVLLHGFPDNAWTWEHQIPALAAAGHRVVAPFLRGYPPSEIPREPDYGAEALADDLNGLIAALSDEPACVAGHDFGAMAVYAALAEPEHRMARACVLAVSHPRHFARLIQHPELIQHGFHLWFLAHPLVGEIGAAVGDMALIDYLWKRWSGGHDDREHCRRVKRETLAQPGGLAAAVSYYRSFVGNGPALARAYVAAARRGLPD
jgi:pimeloyl-ACP methyl ester carboxylesterase